MQPKLTFIGLHKAYENYDSYTFKHYEILTDKPIYLGFVVLELSKLKVYKTYYDKLQPYFGKENIELLYGDSDSLIILVNINGDFFGFGKLIKEDEIFLRKRKGGY